MNEPTTRICTNCQVEKEISEFHRRRNGYQKICKSCRNASARGDYQARGKARLPHSPTQINPANFPALQERIVLLESRLRASASMYAHDKLDADDIYSEMVEAILTKCKPEDNDGFIMQRASWTGQALVSKNMSYNEYVGDLDVDEDALTAGGFKVVNTRTVEDALIEIESFKSLQKVIASLPPENQTVVKMISIGMNQRQIAEKLQVSEQSVSERMKKIRKFFAENMDGNMGLSLA